MVISNLHGQLAREESEEKKPTSIYYNAWEQDYLTELILSLVQEITRQSDVDLSETYIKKAKNLIKFVSKSLPWTGEVDFDRLTDSMFGDLKNKEKKLR